MDLTKKEIMIYAIIVIICTALPQIIMYYPTIFMLTHSTGEPMNHNIINLYSPVKWTCMLLLHLSSAVLIVLAEKRKGGKVSAIAVLLGLFLNFPGFIAYMIWQVIDRKKLFLDDMEA